MDAKILVAKKKMANGTFDYSLVKAKNEAFEGTRVHFGDIPYEKPKGRLRLIPKYKYKDPGLTYPKEVIK